MDRSLCLLVVLQIDLQIMIETAPIIQQAMTFLNSILKMVLQLEILSLGMKPRVQGERESKDPEIFKS